MARAMLAMLVTTLVALVMGAGQVNAQYDRGSMQLWRFESVGIEAAYKKGLSGAGVRIGVEDTLVKFDH